MGTPPFGLFEPRLFPWAHFPSVLCIYPPLWRDQISFEPPGGLGVSDELPAWGSWLRAQLQFKCCFPVSEGFGKSPLSAGWQIAKGEPCFLVILI